MARLGKKDNEQIIKELLIENKILEKENAELKSGCGMCYRKDKEQLTKAKEIIRTFFGFAEAFGYSPSMDKFITDTEQFLSEVENV